MRHAEARELRRLLYPSPNGRLPFKQDGTVRRLDDPAQQEGSNKLARIAWTVLAQDRSYEARVTKAAA
jgi:hypothetical protein